MLKGVIAEDNPYFQRALEQFLTSEGGVEVGYCVGSGEELLRVLKGYAADVVFLDIGLPGISGIDAAKKITEEYPCIEIVFITSYDQYVREAVDLYAADFILKPMDSSRLKRTLERLKFKKGGKVLEVCADKDIYYIRENEIYMVEAFKNKTRIHSKSGQIESSHSLKEIQAMFGGGFFRSSRSYLVNLSLITAVRPCTRTSFEILFPDKDCKAYLSKRLYDSFRRELKQSQTKGGFK